MTGAMQGSTHSLRHKAWTRCQRQWRAAAARHAARRVSSHTGEFALIEQEFAHRFFLAKQEVCASTRNAMLQRLTSEKAAAVSRLRMNSAAEAGVVRMERAVLRSIHRRYRFANVACCKRIRPVWPFRPPWRIRRHSVRINPTR
jgi:hypothetical protein